MALSCPSVGKVALILAIGTCCAIADPNETLDAGLTGSLPKGAPSSG
jgi:hypothetical protein